MITVKNLRVSSLTIGFLDLYWEIENTTEDPLDYDFIVERSEAVSGPWDQVSAPFSDRYLFRDAQSLPFNKWRQLWYRLKITQKSGGTSHYTEVVTQQARPDLTAQEMRRVFALLLKEGVGRMAWVFPVRTFGMRCPACYDELQCKTIVGNCLTCFGTSYARGYMEPIATYMQINPSGKSNQHGPTVKTQQQNTTARLPYFPPLKPDDIIVEAENRRWRVVSVESSERLRAPIRQDVNLHEIPRSDMEYKIPINIDDLRKLLPTPDRHYMNPHVPEAAGSELASFLPGFGNTPWRT